MSLTARGQLLHDVLAGHEVDGVSQTAMEQLARDLAAITPRRYIRTAHGRRGYLRVALVGPADPAYQREELVL